MKPLNVPIVTQKKDSDECGLAVVNMITKYYGLPTNFADLRKAIRVFKGGTYCSQLGSYLIKSGFDIELVKFHPGLFTLQDMKLSQEKILKRLQDQLKIRKKNSEKRSLKFMIQFLKDGGKIAIKIPTSEDIKDEVQNGRPLIALLTSRFLYPENEVFQEPKFNFHYNVITGIDDKYIFANDPAWGLDQVKQRHLIPDFIFGMHATAYSDLEDPCLIKIRKKT